MKKFISTLMFAGVTALAMPLAHAQSMHHEEEHRAHEQARHEQMDHREHRDERHEDHKEFRK